MLCPPPPPGSAPTEAGPLLDFIAGLVRTLEAQQRGAGARAALAPSALRLGAIMVRTGSAEKGRWLAGAFGAKLL